MSRQLMTAGMTAPPIGAPTARGPLFGKVGALFDNENGNSRFYVDAIYQGEGFAVGHQLRIWE